jgi:hypothetical protein
LLSQNWAFELGFQNWGLKYPVHERRTSKGAGQNNREVVLYVPAQSSELSSGFLLKSKVGFELQLKISFRQLSQSWQAGPGGRTHTLH